MEFILLDFHRDFVEGKYYACLEEGMWQNRFVRFFRSIFLGSKFSSMGTFSLIPSLSENLVKDS